MPRSTPHRRDPVVKKDKPVKMVITDPPDHDPIEMGLGYFNDAARAIASLADYHLAKAAKDRET